MKTDVERRSSTRCAKNPAIRKNVGIRHVWMKSNTSASRTDWSSSAGQTNSNPLIREKYGSEPWRTMPSSIANPLRPSNPWYRCVCVPLVELMLTFQ